jgi:hypothetical protein
MPAAAPADPVQWVPTDPKRVYHNGVVRVSTSKPDTEFDQCVPNDWRHVHDSSVAERVHDLIAKRPCTFDPSEYANGLPKDLVLYCGRHDYGTRVLKQTGNLAAVMKTMGHKDVRTAMGYQHPELEIVRAALNQTGPATEPGA